VIVVEFNNVARLLWLGVAFIVSATATTLFQAKIYVHFNAKWTYMWTIFLFEAGSAIREASNNMSALIVKRIICGISGVEMYLGVLTLLSPAINLGAAALYWLYWIDLGDREGDRAGPCGRLLCEQRYMALGILYKPVLGSRLRTGLFVSHFIN
jgi:hypothetical protein